MTIDIEPEWVLVALALIGAIEICLALYHRWRVKGVAAKAWTRLDRVRKGERDAKRRKKQRRKP